MLIVRKQKITKTHTYGLVTFPLRFLTECKLLPDKEYNVIYEEGKITITDKEINLKPEISNTKMVFGN